jgi:transposase
MGHIPGDDRSQQLLLPDAVDDYVGPDNPVRFIDAFVSGLDMAEAGFKRVLPKSTGRPGYNPGDLLKLYVYGYLNRIRSSRRLEAETHRNLEVIWLLRRLQPDFKTIADFRKDNRDAFRRVFRDFVRLCRELDLYGCELVAVDGTRIKAVNNLNRNFTRGKLEKDLDGATERLDRYLKQLDEADADDPGASAAVTDLQRKIEAVRARHATLSAHREHLEKSGRRQLSLTDPDSRLVKTSKGAVVGYNVQIAVDSKHNLIAEQQVHTNVTDVGLLAETAVAARENLAVEQIDVVADRGYYKIGDVEACEAAGVTPHVPNPVRSPTMSKGHFGKSLFRYDETTDTYACPGDHRLRPAYFHDLPGGKRIQYANRAACRSCPLRSRCTTDTHRRISRYANEAVMDRMAERLSAQPTLLDRRRESAEHPFGTIKQWMGQGTFLMRRLNNVRGEFSLTALAYNIRRAINLVGVPALITATTT